MKQRGIIVKINNPYCIILTKDGIYHKVPLNKVNNAVVGAETDFSPSSLNSFLKPLLMVASILIVLLGFNIFRIYENAQPYYYLTLDINPSIEMSVSKNLKILSFQPLNEDAKKLTAGTEINGRDLNSAIGILVNRAVDQGYLKQGRDNYIVSSLTSTGNNTGNAADINTNTGTGNAADISTAIDTNVDKIIYDQISNNIEKALKKRDIQVKMVMLKTDKQTRQEAKKEGLSTGKYLIYRKLIDSGSKISLEDIKKNSITKLINTKQINLPNDTGIIIKTIGKPYILTKGKKTKYDIKNTDTDNPYEKSIKSIRDIQTRKENRNYAYTAKNPPANKSGTSIILNEKRTSPNNEKDMNQTDKPDKLRSKLNKTRRQNNNSDNVTEKNETNKQKHVNRRYK